MLKQFYEDVLPRQGNLCLFTLPSAHHHWCNNIGELVALTSQIEQRYAGEDLYFATAGFKARDRHARNVDLVRALRVDLDAGPEKLAKHGAEAVYADQRAAVAGLMAFVASTKMVPSYIVSSGVGLHVYWALGQDLELREWQPLADGLKALTKLLGLKADPSITADAARVLRPIGSVHVKSGSSVSVIKTTGRKWSALEMRAALAAHVPVAEPGQRRYDARDPLAALGNRTFGDASINQDAMPIYEPSDANLVADKCAVMGHIRETGGQVQEPLWHAMMGVVKYTVQGDEAAHAWSEGDVRYDANDTQRKYDAWEAGPTTCKHISDHSPLCRTCPHFGVISTPVELGRRTVSPPAVATPIAAPAPPPAVQPAEYNDWVAPAATGEPWAAYMPDQYQIRVTNGARTLVGMVPVLDEDGKPKKTEDGISIMQAKLVSNEPFWFTGWGRSETSTDPTLVEYKVLHNDKDAHPMTYTMPQEKVASKTDLTKALADKGILTKEENLMRAYAMDSITKIKSFADRPRVSDRMGPRFLDNGTLVAVHGRHVIYPDRTIRTALVAPTLETVAANFELPLADNPSGLYGPEAWTGIEARARHYLNFLGRYLTHPKMQLAVSLGISSPLLPFVSDVSYRPSGGPTLPASGLTVSIYSLRSAFGKTTTASLAMLAYGHPGTLKTGGSAISSTDNARTTRMSMHGTMPMFVDEVGQAEPKKAAELIEMVANGSARSRSKREGGVNEIIPWSLITLITTNTSARMMINLDQQASDAIQSRLLEIDVGDVPKYSDEQLTRFGEELPRVTSECHGCLGAVLHRELVALTEADREKLEQACLKKARAFLKAEQSGRFVYRALAAMLMQYVLLQRAGLALPFALQPMLDEFKNAYDAGLVFVEANTIPSDCCSVLSLFVHENSRHALVTSSLAVNRFTVVQRLSERIPDTVHIRFGRDDKVMLVSVDAFRHWCHSKGLDAFGLVQQLAGRGVLARSSKGSGMAEWSNYRNMLSGVAGATPGKTVAMTVNVAVLEEQLGEEVAVPLTEAPPSNVIHLTR